jgi:tetratricopeptide (TPR) repeat protein
MSRKKLNGKLLLGLILGTIVLGVGVHTLHGVQVKRNARGLLYRAEQAERDGQLSKAEDYLERYMIYRPGDIDGVVKYAGVLEKQAKTDKDRARLIPVFEKGIGLDSSRADLRRRLISLAIDLKGFSIAEPHVKILQATARDDPELAYLAGRCAEGAARFDEAAKLYETAIKGKPEQVEAYTRLAELLRVRIKNSEKADRVMDAREERDGLIVHNGHSADAFLARARYRKHYNVRSDAASADINRALQLAPDDPAVILEAVEMARSKNDLDTGRQLLRRGLQAHPTRPELYIALSDLELQARRYDDAIACLSDGIRKLPAGEPTKAATLRWKLAESYIQGGRWNEADGAIENLTRENRENIRPSVVDYLKARVLIGRRKTAEGAKKLEGVLPALAAESGLNNLTKRGFILLGVCYERLSDLDKRLDAYRRAVSIDVGDNRLWIEARLGYAAALVDLNRIPEALAEYQILMVREPRAGLSLARLQIHQNLRRDPGAQRWPEVDQTLDNVGRGLKLAGASSLADLAELEVVRGESLAAQGKLGEARKVLDLAIAKYPQEIDLWISLANLASREQGPEAMLKVLEDARKRLGDRVELRVARAEYWAQRGTAATAPAAATALAELERDAGSLPDEDRYRVLRAVASAYGRIGQKPQAKALWLRLAEQRPQDLGIQLTLFDGALAANDDDAATSALNTIHDIEGDNGAMWPLGKGSLLLRKALRSPGSRDALLVEARRDLRQAAIRRPSSSHAPLALAEVEELSGNHEAAVQHYLHAIQDLGDRDPAAVNRALQVLIANDHRPEAAHVVQKLVEEGMPLSGELQRTAARVSLATGNPGQALQFVQGTLSEESKSPEDLMLLGQILWKNVKDAEPVLRRAVALAPADPRTHKALIYYLASMGKRKEAEAVLGDVERTLSVDKATLVLAQGYSRLGLGEKEPQARAKLVDHSAALYQKALAAHPDDLSVLQAAAAFYLLNNRVTDARLLLDKIISHGGTSTEAAWARRAEATITAMEGDRGPALKKALEILGLADSAGTSELASAAPDDLRTKAKILALQPNQAQRHEAIKILEEMARRNVANPDDLFLLAQIYDADGDWSRASQQFTACLSSGTAKPAQLAEYVRALLRHGRLNEAIPVAERLEKLAPRDALTIEIKARVLIARGQAGDAEQLLQAFVREDERRLGWAAKLLESLGRTAAAEAMFRQFVEKFQKQQPTVTLALAGFLGRQGRTKDALDLLDETWKTCPTNAVPAVSSTSIVVLYGAKDDDGALGRRVEERLEAALRSHPDMVAIRFDMANLLCLRKRLDEAEKIYRDLYDHDNTKSSVLNNLAFLLALQLQPDKAREAVELVGKAIALDGETPDLLDTRGVAYLATNQPDLAIRDLETAIAVTPTAEKYFHLARAYQAAKRRGDANQAFNQATTKGLTESTLHPLERPAYAELTKLAGRPSGR